MILKITEEEREELEIMAENISAHFTRNAVYCQIGFSVTAVKEEIERLSKYISQIEKKA